jgi:integrase
MPRRSKGPRIWFRKEKRNRRGKLIRRGAWIILDEGRHFATGCFAREDKASAERKLAEHIVDKYRPARKERDLELIDVADVLAIYFEDTKSRQASTTKFEGRIERLNEFFGHLKLSQVTGETCREYVRLRGNQGGSRRDLEDLRAAIEYHAREGLHRGIVRVTLPEKGLPRDRWLNRDEVASLVWACWRYREIQTIHRGNAKGDAQPTEKRPLRHIARFILIAIYTGSRAGTVLTASPRRGQGLSYVDLDAGIFYRLAEGARLTNKRQPPVPLPPRLLAHLRRWVSKRLVSQRFVEWHGQPVQSIKTAFKTAVRLAKIPGTVTPHTLRHTAATWLMQSGVDKWEAAGFLGMSVEMLDRVYGHHHPDHLRRAALSLGYRPRQSLAITLAAAPRARQSQTQLVENNGGPGRTRTSNQTVMSGRL